MAKRWMTEEQIQAYLRRSGEQASAPAVRSSQSRQKYGNRRTEVDGITFDSAKEARRYQALKLLEAAGKISELKVHPHWFCVVNGVLVCKYVADFSYLDGERWFVCEDVKGIRTPVYRLKRALMAACHGIIILET